MSLTQATTTLYAIWDIPVERIEITPQRIVLYPGQLYRPQVEIFPANATNQTLSWRTGNKSTVVSVSASGLISANRVGTATVMAISTSRPWAAIPANDSIIVEVVPQGSVKYLNLFSGERRLYSGDIIWVRPGYSHLLTAEVLPTTATNRAVTWSSNKTNVAVSINGNVTAITSGFAEVTCKTVDRGLTESVIIIAANSETEYNSLLQEYYESINPWRYWNRFFDTFVPDWGVIGVGGSFSIGVSNLLDGDVSGMIVVDGFGNVGFLVSVFLGKEFGVSPSANASLMINWGARDIFELGIVATANEFTKGEIKNATGLTVGGGSITAKGVSFGAEFSWSGGGALPSGVTFKIGASSLPASISGHMGGVFNVIIPLNDRR